MNVAEVVNRGPARVDAVEQDLDHGLAQAGVLHTGEPSGGAQRVDARAEESLVGVDVADPRDATLVEQERLDRGGAPPRERPQVSGGEPLVQRLQPEAGSEELLQRRLSEQQLTGAEAPRVDDHEPAASATAPPAPGDRRGLGSTRRSWPNCAKLDPRAHVGRLGSRLTEDRPGHPQVLDEEDLVGETPYEVLAAPLQALHAPPHERVGQLLRGERARPAGVEDLHARQAPTLHEGGKLAADRLDLGELGQVASLCPRGTVSTTFYMGPIEGCSPTPYVGPI